MSVAVPRNWPARAALAVTAIVASSGTALAQKLGQGADDGISTWRVVAVLLLCLALAVFAAYALRVRMGGKLPFAFFTGTASDRRLVLKETLRLSHQIDLCIVLCDGQEFLVAASAQGAQLLHEIPPRPGSAAAPA